MNRLQRSRVGIALFVVIGMAASAMLVAGSDWWSRRRDPMYRLVAASSADVRDIQPRLTGGFHWAPLRSASAASARDPFPLAAIAGTLSTKNPLSVPERHTAAVAHLLAGRPKDTVRMLELLSSEQMSSPIASDLATAYYVLATRERNPAHLTRALVAVDAALRAEPSLAEAHFNRALILEALGLRTHARKQWDAYLQLDSGSEWATEAREHVRALAPEESFLTVANRTYEQLADDPGAARAFARRYPQESRTWGSKEILARWAEAERDGDAARAARHLAIAREIAKELVRGDRMLLALTEAIDRANPEQRRALVQAHLHFRDGLNAYRERRIAEAERTLLRASREFHDGNSPGELRARYFSANALFDLGHLSASGERLRSVLDALPREFPAQRAEVLWELGGVALAEGRWGTCLDAFRESAATFERLGERNYAAIMHSHLVYVYDRLGNTEAAWKSRMLALRELGRTDTDRLLQAIASITLAAVMEEDWPVALSFLPLQIDLAERLPDPIQHIEALLYRAEVNLRMNERDAASIDAPRARQMIDRLTDPSDREFLDASASAVEASLARPADAVAILTAAIDFHSREGKRMYLPSLLLRRARALHELGDDDRAAADLEAGVKELERHRESLPDNQDRWGIFHASRDLFGEAIALSLARKDVQAAFDYVERARARALLDTFGAGVPRVTPSDVPAGTMIVEYAIHERTIFIFTLDARGIRVFSQPLVLKTLVAEIPAFVRAIERSDLAQARTLGRALYGRLLQPIEAELTGHQRLVIVPDPALGGTPFAALVDGNGQFVVERHAVTIAPSAAVFAHLARTPKPAPQHVLIVASNGKRGALAHAEREADGVASFYTRVTQLKHEAATRRGFVREAGAADVIHFIGHSSEGSLWLTGADEVLDQKQIAKMRLPRTSTVVLASCGTAAGEVHASEGTISLARAFLAAGVPSVVATLWPIEDGAAAEFFPVVHQHLARGLAPADALRATQLEWIRAGNRPMSLWASVELVGH